MEQHKTKLIIDKDNIPTLDLDYLEYFRRALQFTKDNYKETIERIQNTKFDALTIETFWREYIWCVYTSGFNAKVVSGFFDQLIEVYKPLLHYAQDKQYNLTFADRVRIRALEYCNNKRKVDAIFKMADILHLAGEDNWSEYKHNNLNTPEKLQTLPFIGPITCFHIARNIGILDVVKPDKHLVRMANKWNFDNARKLCKAVKEHYDMELGIIDLVFWYAASQFGTKEIK